MSDHAALMDRVYHRQRHIYDFSRKFYLLGRDPLIERLSPPDGGAVLEVACGTGRNLIAIARAWPRAKVFGFDISREMLATAGKAVAKSGFGDRIRLGQGDAASFEAEALFGRREFDRIVISYALSMIPPWREALSAAYAHLAPDGELHIVDFGRQSGWPPLARRALRAWLAAFEVTPRDDLRLALEGIARTKGAEVGFEPKYRDYAVLATARRRSPEMSGVSR